jgi:hypothetical protein
LFALCAITAFVAAELVLFHNSTAFKSVGSPNDSADPLVALAALGTTLNVAFVYGRWSAMKRKASVSPNRDEPASA